MRSVVKGIMYGESTESLTGLTQWLASIPDSDT
ncbi:hypothetical protein NSPZN2_80024 [Nitrospira defluvii]|uniref:Transposase n=1 Tax=Nitrospira defluvii TaxID=330214 RepID=A0ABM8SBU4_9BACT|nr:hypothetical protein NSPZN2_80024 [Nitrospira defluvii]